jgi:hypothetical protein
MSVPLSVVEASPAVAVPLVYEPSFEVIEDGEAETCEQLVKSLLGISETTFKDSGHALRSVHAKSHGLLRGELRVLPGLSNALAQGIFARPGSWPLVMRLATTPGDILDDSVSTPRSMAVKVIGVEGERLGGSADARTQDFVLVTGAAFGAPTAKKFLSTLKLLAHTTDKAPKLKNALSAVLRGTEKIVEALGGESGTLKALGGYPETHILGETFYSQAPILFGPYMAKVAVAPVSPELLTLVKSPLNVNGKPNGLREAVIAFFSAHAAEWEVRVQLCVDLKSMPIEDSSVPWSQVTSPYLAVGRIRVPRQLAWSEARSRAIDDGMSFSPWHGIAAHRPIGSIMRVRKVAYEQSAKFRADRNGAPIREPRDLDDLPGQELS